MPEGQLGPADPTRAGSTVEGMNADTEDPRWTALVELLIDADTMTLSPAAGGRLTVRIPHKGSTVIGSFAELPDALEDDSRWEQEPRRPFEPSVRGNVLKAAPAQDLYCVWSGVSDGPVWVDDRAGLARAGVSEARLLRADRYGASSVDWQMPEGYPQPHRHGGWDTSGFIVSSPQGQAWLPRANLAAFLQAVVAEDREAQAAQLESLSEE